MPGISFPVFYNNETGYISITSILDTCYYCYIVIKSSFHCREKKTKSVKIKVYARIQTNIAKILLWPSCTSLFTLPANICGIEWDTSCYKNWQILHFNPQNNVNKGDRISPGISPNMDRWTLCSIYGSVKWIK